MDTETKTATIGRALPLVLIAAIVLGGSYLRLTDLGQAHFNGDELDHYYAAVSLKAGEGPALPSGVLYERGIDITRLVSRTVGTFSQDETAARIPSAMFGILNLVFFAIIAWMMAGAWPAVCATLLLAIYPEAVIQSRMTRFYTYQLNFGLLAMLAGWQALKTAGAADVPTAREYRRQWLWGLAALFFFLLATRVQTTTLSVLTAWLVCVAVAAVADGQQRGWGEWRRSFAIQATILGLGAALVMALLFGDWLVSAVRLSQFVPAWSSPGQDLAYYYLLSRTFPLIVALIPLIFLVNILRDGRLGLYLTIWFGVPLLLHSLAFPWKGERYVLLAMPALFLATGIAAVVGFGALRSWTSSRLGKAVTDRFGGGGKLVTAVAIVTVALAATLTQPAFNEAHRIPPIPKAIDWRAARAIIDDVPESPSLPLGSSMALPALYYWDRTDFVVGTDFLERPRDDLRGVVTGEQGSPDWYSGAPTLTNPEAIRGRFGDDGAVIIGIDTDRWRFGNIDPALIRVLEAEGRELCEGRCGDFLLFLWQFEDGSLTAGIDQPDA